MLNTTNTEIISLEDFNVTRHTFDLFCGTHVVIFNRPKMPIYIQLTFMAGPRFDPVGKEGLAHFMEHMLVSGTKSFPTKDMLSGFIEDLGGSINAFVSSDKLDINISLGDVNDLELGIKLLADVLLNSIFDENTIEKERGAILRELEAYKSSPRNMLIMEMTKPLVYQNTTVGRSLLGSKESINNITREDLINFYHKFIKGSLSTLLIAGDIDLTITKSLLEKYLVFERGSKFSFSKELPVYRSKIIDYTHFKNESLETRLSFRTTNIQSEDTPALNVLANILSGGTTGVLKKKLRYERGLIYSIESNNNSFVDGGSFNILTSVHKTNLQEALDIICTELNRIAVKGPLEEELTLVKNRILKSAKVPLQTSKSWVDTHSYRDLFFPEKNWTTVDYLKEVSAVTTSDIQRVASKYLTKDNWYLLLSGAVDDYFIEGIKINLS